MLELVGLPAVKGLEGSSLLPLLEDPAAERVAAAVTTWHYNNHSVRDQDFRYIRYRDETEDPYDHRSDPGEHRNLAANSTYKLVKARLAAFLPRTNAIPQPIAEGSTDSFARSVENLLATGIPSWLGRVPEVRTAR